MKISPAITEILTFNKWSSKVDRFQKRDVDHVVERLVEEWSRFAIATQPVPRLQIRPIVHN